MIQEERRKKIDQKLEENAAKEKKKFQQETKLLVEEMHLEQAKISRLQQKMDMVAEVVYLCCINNYHGVTIVRRYMKHLLI